MSDSTKGFWAVSAFAYSCHYFVGSVSLCGAHSYHPFFSHSSPFCRKNSVKNVSKLFTKYNIRSLKMLKKIEFEIEAICEFCAHFKYKTLLPSDGHICELDGDFVQPLYYCDSWV